RGWRTKVSWLLPSKGRSKRNGGCLGRRETRSRVAAHFSSEGRTRSIASAAPLRIEAGPLQREDALLRIQSAPLRIQSALLRIQFAPFRIESALVWIDDALGWVDVGLG